MGWCSDCMGSIHTAKEQRARLDRCYDGGNVELLKSSIKNGVYYCAYRNKETGNIAAGVCLFHNKDGEFWYKDMTEHMGPFEDSCPESILKMLTPTDSKYAKAWRERCWKKIKDRKETAAFKRTALTGYVVQIKTECNTTFVSKLTDSRLTRCYYLQEAIVSKKEVADENLKTVQECYAHCGFKNVSIVTVRRDTPQGLWQLESAA